VKQILNVNDQPALRKIASRILSEAGYRILEAGSGEEAIETLKQTKPDLVLLDVQLPGLSGYDVCRTMKQDPALSTIPVVMMSGHFRAPENKSTGIDAGADAYLTLPLQKENLLAIVSELA
jgi:CheY-like chemotaxis protein